MIKNTGAEVSPCKTSVPLVNIMINKIHFYTSRGVVDMPSWATFLLKYL